MILKVSGGFSGSGGDHKSIYGSKQEPKQEGTMKKMQCINILILILLAGCGAPPACICQCDCPQETPISAPAVMETEPVPPTPKVWMYEDMVVGFVNLHSEWGWRLANEASFREIAAELGIKLKVYTTTGDVNQQMDGFRHFVADEEVNVIVMTALESEGWDYPLLEARDAGKIVIPVDRKIYAPSNLYATYIGSDFVEEGRKAAVEMCKLLESTPDRNVWELTGPSVTYVARDRGSGFHEKLGECGMEITRSQAGNWSAVEAKQLTASWLKESRDVQGIFAQNDEMALGAIEALKEAGLKPGVDVKIISIDATSAAFEAMLKGELNASVECNPLMAPQVYEAALRALNGESLPKWIPTVEGVFRSDMPNLQEIAEDQAY